MATAIEFNNISKIYRLGMVGTGTLAHDLKRWWTMNIQGKEDPYLTIGETNDRSTKGDSEYVWALRDIDFKVEQGDVVGIIGKNGAGKSTLLKILSKVTAPTTGTIRARGRIGSLLEVGTGFHPEMTGRENIYMNGAILGMTKIGSLLEVGTGFHPEMTGRENIYMNGAILGMTKAEITKKLDEIVDFSGCERYIDTPVKRYSSGMMVRLGFAVAAHLDPEILIVDEVLAVGDAEFQKKAIGKMQDVSRGEGRTVLFVSHNMDAVLNLCKTGVLLENGKVKLISTAKEAIDAYTSSSTIGSSYSNNIPKDKVYISHIQYYNDNDEETNHFTTEEPIIIRNVLQRNPNYQIPPHAKYSINIFRNTKIICTMECGIEKLNSGSEAIINFKIPKQFFTSGSIHLNTAIHVPNVELFDYAQEICHCEIIDSTIEMLKYSDNDYGVVQAHPQINIQIT